MANISGVVSQLRRERTRVSRELERLDSAIAALAHITGRSNGHKSTSAAVGRKPRRRLSAAARARIAAAQRARWARVKAKLAKKAA